MSETRRQAIEQELRKWLSPRPDVSPDQVRGLLPQAEFNLMLNNLATLLAPVPSREALEKILDGHTATIRGEQAVFVTKRFMQERFVEQLLAWSQGARERMWCKDIVWQDGDWRLFCGAEGVSLAGQPSWGVVMADWTVCPICAKPRPTEGR